MRCVQPVRQKALMLPPVGSAASEDWVQGSLWQASRSPGRWMQQAPSSNWEWHPASSTRVATSRGAFHARRCLNRRRLIVAGDSVSNGFFLDVCIRLGGDCSLWESVIRGLPSSAAVFVPVFASPARVGLANMLVHSQKWVHALAAANNSIVVLQSMGTCN